MSRYARQRDANEPIIIAALRAVGASVQTLDETGVPDLLVGHAGQTYLLEVKREHGKAEAKGKRTASGLRETQEAWWARWKGSRPVAVTTVDEALVAIGVRRG